MAWAFEWITLRPLDFILVWSCTNLSSTRHPNAFGRVRDIGRAVQMG
jgi:hypothetical protein